MGMYTELNISLELKKDTPTDVLQVLAYMTNKINDIEKSHIPNHELFQDTRWRFMLQGNSYYFDMTVQHDLRFDQIAQTHCLSVRSNFKNYENEIEKFLDWIKPYTETTGFIGYSRYESDREPTLIYFD